MLKEKKKNTLYEESLLINYFWDPSIENRNKIFYHYQKDLNRIVGSQVRKFHYQYSQEEFLSLAVEGFFSALLRYDICKNPHFLSYAYKRIVGAIKDWRIKYKKTRPYKKNHLKASFVSLNYNSNDDNFHSDQSDFYISKKREGTTKDLEYNEILEHLVSKFEDDINKQIFIKRLNGETYQKIAEDLNFSVNLVCERYNKKIKPLMQKHYKALKIS